MDNLPRKSFHVLTAGLFETETPVPKHIHVTSAAYIAYIEHFLQDERSPELDALLVSNTEEYVPGSRHSRTRSNQHHTDTRDQNVTRG